MARILCTGAAGFIGSYICKGLITQGHTVIGVDDLSGGALENLPRQPHPLFSFYKVDLNHYADIQEVFAANRPEIVYHCASCAREGASEFQPRHITYSNLMASLTTFELAIQYSVKKIVFTSSCSVYGENKTPFEERYPRRPVDPYGINKAATEHCLEVLAETHGFQWTILRPHNVVGCGQAIDRYRNVAAIFINSILRDEPLYLFGEGHVRAFSNIKDSMLSFLRAADLDEKLNKQIINVGGKEPVSIQGFAEECLKYFPEKKNYPIIQAPARPHETKESWATTRKSEELLGYKESYGWRAAIEEMVDWMKQRGPTKWKIENLPLLNDKAPEVWRKKP